MYPAMIEDPSMIPLKKTGVRDAYAGPPLRPLTHREARH